MTTALLAFVLLPLSAQDRSTAGYVPDSMAAFDLPWLVKYYDSGLSLPDCAPEDLARAGRATLWAAVSPAATICV